MTSTQTVFAVGDTAPPRDFGPLTRQMFVRYSGASGDLNPMHYDDEMARSAGNPSVFSQGMHHSALLATFATDWLGAANVRRFGVRFREQVWPGDILTCTGTITAITDGADGETLATVELICSRQTGAIAIAGSADFVITRAQA